MIRYFFFLICGFFCDYSIVVAAEDASPIFPEPVAASSVLSQPEQHAKYLNAPPPPYPEWAKKMGAEGRVVLHVEVLSDGNPGQVKILHSSGHELLDNVARATVQQRWKFIPARRGGNVVTHWYQVPIRFYGRE
ncbi:MAG: energy transducer TonB [Gallionella sp.]|nr:energy transducer TonB [Gallionella sp.]MCK9353175.1 energy transducer TonB [Gallionella sp.]